MTTFKHTFEIEYTSEEMFLNEINLHLILTKSFPNGRLFCVSEIKSNNSKIPHLINTERMMRLLENTGAWCGSSSDCNQNEEDN